MNDIDSKPAHESASAPPMGASTGEPPRNLRKVGLIALVAALLIAVGGIVLRWMHEHDVAQWTDAQARPVVSVLEPKRGAQGLQTVLPGSIQAWYEASIYARVSGYLKKWYFDYGARVKKGDLLAEIDAPDLDAELSAGQATLRAAEAQIKVREAEMEFAHSTYERWRDSPKGVVSVQETESKKADFNSANARYNASLADLATDKGGVDRLQALESYKRIVAPFDGIVIVRNTDIGALINAGSGTGGGSAPQLFKVADVHEMRVFVQVPQEMSAGIHAGLAAQLRLPQYPDRAFQATVATTAGAISESSRTLLVELHADNPSGELQPGTYAEVHFDLPSNPNMVRIPTSALIFRRQGMQVAVVDSTGRIELKAVTLGRNLGTDVEVLSGLSTQERIVESPPDSLATGEHVDIAQNADQSEETPTKQAEAQIHEGSAPVTPKPARPPQAPVGPSSD